MLLAVTLKEDPGKTPDHQTGVKLDAIETKLDYMGSSILMNRLSMLSFSLRDEWKVDTGSGDKQPLATKRCVVDMGSGDK